MGSSASALQAAEEVTKPSLASLVVEYSATTASPTTPSNNSKSPKKDRKVDLYRQIKDQFKKIDHDMKANPEQFENLSLSEREAKEAEIVANTLHVSEALVKALSSKRYLAPPILTQRSRLASTPIRRMTSSPFDRFGRVDIGAADSELLTRVNRAQSGVDFDSLDEEENNVILDALPEVDTPPTPSNYLEVIDKISGARFHNFLVGVDGSQSSMLAFRTCLLLRKPRGKFSVVFVDDVKKKMYLPLDEQWEGISDKVEAELAPFVPPTLYNVTRIQKPEMKTTKATFVNFANESFEPYFVVVGWSGRKGPKGDPTILGSVTDVAMRGCHHPVVIVKSLPPGDHSTPHHFLVCVDGNTRRGNYAFETTLAMMKMNDRVTVVHCHKNGAAEEFKASEVQKYFEKELYDYGLASATNTFHRVTHKLHKTVAQCLAMYIGEEMPTFVVVVPDPPASMDTNSHAAQFQYPGVSGGITSTTLDTHTGKTAASSRTGGIEERGLLSTSDLLLRECKSNFIILKVEKEQVEGGIGTVGSASKDGSDKSLNKGSDKSLVIQV